VADAAFAAFKKKTGIDVDYWRASATKVMDRAVNEYRAGKPLFDVILTNDNPMQIMVKEGIFAKYDSPSAKDFTKESIDPNLVQRCSYRPMHSPTSRAFFRRRNRSSSTCETRKTWTASA